MGEEDLTLAAEVVDVLDDVDTHSLEVPLTEGETAVVAGNQIENAIECIGILDDVGDPPDRAHRRVIRMKPLLDARFLGHGDNSPEEVLEVLP